MPAFEVRGRAAVRRRILRASASFSRVLVAEVVRCVSRQSWQAVWQRARTRVRGWHYAKARRRGGAVRKKGTRVGVCPGLLRGVDERGRRVAQSVQAT